MSTKVGIGRRYGAVLAAAVLVAVGAGQTLHADASREKGRPLQIVGLTDDGRLIRFRADAPRRAREIGTVSGLQGADTMLVGIDFRVQDGRLYGVGDGGGVYTLDLRFARARFVNQLTVPLDGTSFGVDFNPVADRLRIISDTGQNLAHNVNAGGVTTVQSPLTFTAPPAMAAIASGVTAAAYTNNDLDQPLTSTTLFDLDTAGDQVVIQSPPGNGILAATGRLGPDAGTAAGFDIYSRLERGVTVSNEGFASLMVGGRAAFYRVELTTGWAIFVDTFRDTVVDVAVPLDQDY